MVLVPGALEGAASWVWGCRESRPGVLRRCGDRGLERPERENEPFGNLNECLKLIAFRGASEIR